MLLGNDNTAGGKALKDTFKIDFAKRFYIEILGTPTKFLGMEIDRDVNTLSLTQTAYISKAADKFLSGSSTHTFTTPVASPMDPPE